MQQVLSAAVAAAAQGLVGDEAEYAQEQLRLAAALTRLLAA
jgi:hypothetical protein